MAIECRHEDYEGHSIDSDVLDDLERRRAAKLNVEEHDVRGMLDERRDCVIACPALADACDTGQVLELAAQSAARDRLVVNDQYVHDVHVAAVRNGIAMSTHIPAASPFFKPGRNCTAALSPYK